MRAGFPHSDISGSKLVCQLPGAFRRLPRPSSPVIAKASTTCTCSLDPITRASLFEPLALQVEFSHLCRIPRASFDSLFILRYNHYPLISSTSISSDASNIHYYFFQIVKDRQPTCSVALTGSIANDKGSSGCAHAFVIGDDGGGRRDRTDDPLLAKQVLSQLSYAPQGTTNLTLR